MVYNCQSCAACCKGQVPDVTLEEIEAISNFIGLPGESFAIKSHSIMDHYFLKIDAKGGSCSFLENDGADKLSHYYCSIYSVRPKVCADFPSTERAKAMCDRNNNSRT